MKTPSDQDNLTVEDKLKLLKPGVNYCTSFTVKETVEGKSMEVKFLFQSYQVGMYKVGYLNGERAFQAGASNEQATKGAIKDIKAALKRGAMVEIGAIQPIMKLPVG